MPTASDSHDTPGKNVPTQIVGDETRSASEIDSESGVPNDDAEPVCARRRDRTGRSRVPALRHQPGFRLRLDCRYGLVA